MATGGAFWVAIRDERCCFFSAALIVIQANENNRDVISEIADDSRVKFRSGSSHT